MAKLKHIAKSDPSDPDWRFYCPGCKRYHVFRTTGEGSLWTFNGDIDKPTVGGSVLTNPLGRYHDSSSPLCHLFIRNGIIQYLPDCTHELVGKYIVMQDINEVNNE